jgi:chloride channel 7
MLKQVSVHYVAQVSNDVRMLLPLLIGILAAKWVADAATHSLYHGLLEVKSPSRLPSPQHHFLLLLIEGMHAYCHAVGESTCA